MNIHETLDKIAPENEAVDLSDLATYAHGYLDAESKYRRMIEGGELVEVVMQKGERMDDSISRKAAIDAIQKDREISWKELENDDDEYRNGCDDGYAYSMQIISELPSAERKKGKWISVHDDVFADRYYCSCCKTEPICSDTEYVLSNFCPTCGADMRGYNDG